MTQTSETRMTLTFAKPYNPDPGAGLRRVPTVAHAFTALVSACASGSPALMESAKKTYALALLCAQRGR